MSHIEERIKNEIDFINQIEIILLDQIKSLAKGNRKLISNVYEEKALKLIRRMIYNELDYLTSNKLDYNEIYLMNEDFD
jgi:hypothetical protein